MSIPESVSRRSSVVAMTLNLRDPAESPPCGHRQVVDAQNRDTTRQSTGRLSTARDRLCGWPSSRRPSRDHGLRGTKELIDAERATQRRAMGIGYVAVFAVAENHCPSPHTNKSYPGLFVRDRRVAVDQVKVIRGTAIANDNCVAACTKGPYSPAQRGLEGDRLPWA